MAQPAINLSLALIVKNEARCLARCLSSIRRAVDEIVLVDTGSTDDTIAIARSFEAKILQFTWTNDFSAARNFAVDQTTGSWILVLDADEEASPELAAEIPSFIGSKRAIGRLKIVSEFRRKGQLLRSQSYVSRLFPRGVRFEGRIHEQLVSSLPRLDLNGELWHDGYLQPGKSDRNLTLLQEQLRHTPKDPYLLFQLALEHTSLDQTTEACQCLEHAMAVSNLTEPFAPNLVVDYLYTLTELKRFDAALALIEKASKTLDDFPDFHLASGLFYLQLVRSNAAKYISHLPKIENSFKRAIALGETSKYKSVCGAGTFLAQYNLGTLYHVFGDGEKARTCFAKAAALGYKPAVEMLERLTS